MKPPPRHKAQISQGSNVHVWHKALLVTFCDRCVRIATYLSLHSI